MAIGGKTRLFIGEESPITELGLRTLLEPEGFEIVGTADSGPAVLERFDPREADLLLLSKCLHDIGGIEIARTLRLRHIATPIVLFTGELSDGPLSEVMEIGLEGLLRKDSPSAIILRCLKAVASGERWIDKEMLQRALELSLASRGMITAGPSLQLLSSRNRQIASLIARGLRNREIAEELRVSEGTVKSSVQKILTDLNLKNRTQIAQFSADHTDKVSS